MTAFRSAGGQAGARVAVYTAVTAMLGLLGATSTASGLIITGGPRYNLPGGGSCVLSADVASRTGGRTISCSGVNLGAHTKVYFGLKNAEDTVNGGTDVNVNGNTMTGAQPAPAGSAVFRFASNTASTITYTSTTSITDVFHGTHSVNNELRLVLTSGSATIVAAAGNPANNGNGDIQQVFQITSSSFSIRADVRASDTFFALGYACPAVYDPSHATFGAFGDISKVDFAFYFSDCGDGEVDSPEQCDEGGANGSLSSCCTATCQLRPDTEICRPGAGAPCDLSETCSGIAPDCPPDDAIINSGNVCRMGSGDLCDENETCTGVPGEPCPPDDAPDNTMVVCRAASVGDICDQDELCSGAPGATCPPDDAPGQINFVCRPGSGDVCDPPEQCTGIAGQGCPADVVANPSTVCRVGSGDSCDPNENCTAVPGAPCPADVVTPSGTQCRAAANACDVAEACTGTAGQTCPANGFAAAATPCNLDNDLCTVDECNGSGACVLDSPLDCDDGNVCSQDTCDPMTGCDSTGTPSMSCVTASRALLKIKNKSNDASDGAKFLWKGGPAPLNDLGNPTTTTRYELCIYDATGLQMAMGVPPMAGWTATSTGFKFKDTAAANDGAKLIKLKSSTVDKAQAKFLAKGGAMPDTATMPFQYPVIAQLYASDGMCWEAEFGAMETRTNTVESYKAKSP
jgi:hypothetical protein